MRSNDIQQPVGLEGASFRELRLLEEIQRTPEVSQRQLARQLGVALGIANALVRNLAKRGYILAYQVGWKRWVYVLTPSGINRKLQLTLEYIENFLGHYRRVRFLLHEDLSDIATSSDSQIAVHGVTELSELIYLILLDLGINNVEFVVEEPLVSHFLGRPVRSLGSAVPHQYEKVIVASPVNLEAQRSVLTVGGFAPDQIVTLMNGSNQQGGMADEPQAK